MPRFQEIDRFAQGLGKWLKVAISVVLGGLARGPISVVSICTDLAKFGDG